MLKTVSPSPEIYRDQYVYRGRGHKNLLPSHPIAGSTELDSKPGSGALSSPDKVKFQLTTKQLELCNLQKDQIMKRPPLIEGNSGNNFR